jgi:hypothetical protein
MSPDNQSEFADAEQYLFSLRQTVDRNRQMIDNGTWKSETVATLQQLKDTNEYLGRVIWQFQRALDNYEETQDSILLPKPLTAVLAGVLFVVLPAWVFLLNYLAGRVF